MRMARRMERHSAPIVGKSRNITDMGIVMAWGILIRSMAEITFPLAIREWASSILLASPNRHIL